MHRPVIYALVGFVATSSAGLAQQVEPYTAPRTVDGHPDFQGVWATEFVTTLERAPDVESLIASPEAAQALAASIQGGLPDNIDPDLEYQGLNQLAMVKGEYRTSVIVKPENGLLPYTEAGQELATWSLARDEELFDSAEQRPLVERCLENWGMPPIRALPVMLPRQILQTRDHLVIVSEDSVGRRLIHLHGEPPPDALRSIEGHAIGRWEGETLVVQTTHLRADDPVRAVLGRPIVLSRDTRITERFTRVSEQELFYQYTVDDDGLYTQSWSGELSMAQLDGPIYEYACHEGNYSIPLALSGGRAQDRAETASR